MPFIKNIGRNIEVYKKKLVKNKEFFIKKELHFIKSNIDNLIKKNIVLLQTQSQTKKLFTK